VSIARRLGRDIWDSIYAYNDVLSVEIIRILHENTYRKSARLERYCGFQSCTQVEKQTLRFLFWVGLKAQTIVSFESSGIENLDPPYVKSLRGVFGTAALIERAARDAMAPPSEWPVTTILYDG
jgi:hypothetical protein